MATPKDIRDLNRETWDRDAAASGRWSTPVSPEEIAAARAGDWAVYLIESRPTPREWFGEIAGRRVLGLAASGGQQSPILAAAGAKVTVLDNSPGQLSRDAEVAAREGLQIETVEGDMADLPFGDASFDLVFHPVSNLFIPDVRPVWRECFRVLAPGGVLLAGFLNPADYLFEWEAEDKGELKFAYSLPFSALETFGEDRLRKEGWAAEFSHSLEDQIGGQLSAGLVLTHLIEAHRKPGTSPKAGVFPSYIATRAVKPGA